MHCKQKVNFSCCTLCMLWVRIATEFSCVVCLKCDQTCMLGHQPTIQALGHNPRPSASGWACGPKWLVMPQLTCLIVYIVLNKQGRSCCDCAGTKSILHNYVKNRATDLNLCRVHGIHIQPKVCKTFALSRCSHYLYLS